jgi:hypothetical protein
MCFKVVFDVLTNYDIQKKLNFACSFKGKCKACLGRVQCHFQTLKVTSGVMGKSFDILILNSETKTEHSEFFHIFTL